MSAAGSSSSKIAVLLPRGGKGGGSGKRPPIDNSWKDHLVWSREGEVKGTPHNMLLILEHDPELKGLFAMDVFANKIALRGDAPWKGAVKEYRDTDSMRLAAWLGAPDRYRMAARVDLVEAGVTAIAEHAAYHPVREYLDGLEWDQVERIPTLLPKYYRVADTPYARQVGLAWLISAVARIYQPGCKVDHMLVLEGAQGFGKSSATRLMFGEAWYTEALNSPQDKDFYVCLIGKWCVEIAEMQAFQRADVPKVKQAISNQCDSYRAPYARTARSHPRQCVFVGSTNDQDWNRDPTGARRFYPALVEAPINLEGLRDIRDQLWAEARVRYQRGELWHQVPDGAAEQQEQRYQDDAWAEPIAIWLEGGFNLYVPQVVRNKQGQVERTSLADLLAGAIGLELPKQSRAEQMRASAILRRLGWECARIEIKGQKHRQWLRPAPF